LQPAQGRLAGRVESAPAQLWPRCGGDALSLPLSDDAAACLLGIAGAGASMFDNTLWLAATILFIVALAIIVVV
jgi:hypothetical protein